MALITWQPGFETKIEIIDQQHKLLVDLINELFEAFTTNQEQDVIAGLFNKLGVYAAMHFAREEHYFERFNYPGIEDHLREHDHFEDMISRFEEEYLKGKEDMSISIFLFLSEWLVSHINESDKKYVSYLSASVA